MTTVDQEISRPVSGASAHRTATAQRPLYGYAGNERAYRIRLASLWLAGLAIVIIYLLHARWIDMRLEARDVVTVDDVTDVAHKIVLICSMELVQVLLRRSTEWIHSDRGVHLVQYDR